nr:FecR domain-containing protein [uncultured Carboxylicivirga sp.]
MITKDNIQLLKKFLEGNASAEDEKVVYNLFYNHADDSEFKRVVKDELQEYFNEHEADEYNTDQIFYKVRFLIDQKQQERNRNITKQIFKWYARIAAILLLPIIVVSYLLMNQPAQMQLDPTMQVVENTINVPMGARVSFKLPDGTTGWLNSGSKLAYNMPFTNREISLEGEGWFDVAHDENHPFEINTGESKVQVLGTVFNLCAYPEEKYIEIALEKGSVMFSASDLDKGVELKPNEKLKFENGRVNVSETEAYKYGAWRQGNLVFRGDSMEEVAKRIERWYNVEVKIMDEKIKAQVIRGTFQDDSLEEVMHFLSLISPLEYKIIDKKILKNNTVSKKKVLIYKKKTK